MRIQCGLIAVAMLAAGLAGCGKTPPAAPAAGGGNLYHMRGEVAGKELSDPAHPALQIRHEPVDDFVDSTGQVSGMGTMTMPFEAAAGVSIDGVNAGDKIAFDWRVDWKSNSAKIEKIEKLPAGTELKFGPARHGAEDAGKASATTTGSATIR